MIELMSKKNKRHVASSAHKIPPAKEPIYKCLFLLKASPYTSPTPYPFSIHNFLGKKISAWSLSIALVLPPSLPKAGKTRLSSFPSFEQRQLSTALELWLSHQQLSTLIFMPFHKLKRQKPKRSLVSALLASSCLRQKKPKGQASVNIWQKGHNPLWTPAALSSAPSMFFVPRESSMCGQEFHCLFDYNKPLNLVKPQFSYL